MSEMVRRAADVLDVLARGDERLSVREIAAECALSKSAVQRLLSALVDTGLATQDPVTRRYGLGPRTLVLGTAYQRTIDLRRTALPHMTRLRDATGETVGLSVAVGEDLLHIEQVESRSELRRSFEIGRTLPLWCGAPSRMLLADMPAEQAERIAHDRRPAAVVPTAPPDAEDLLRSVEESRRRGFAVACGETIAGVNTVAAPVRGGDDRTLATISVTGPASRMSPERMQHLVADLLRCVGAVSALLGYEGAASAAQRKPRLAELDSGEFEVRAATR